MLVAVSAASVILVDQAREDNAWVVHTVEVENQVSTVLLEIRRAEGAARGYLLTSQPQFLEEYQTAAAGIVPDLEKLSRQIGDNPVQIESIRDLRPLVEIRLAEFATADRAFRMSNSMLLGISVVRGVARRPGDSKRAAKKRRVFAAASDRRADGIGPESQVRK